MIMRFTALSSASRSSNGPTGTAFSVRSLEASTPVRTMQENRKVDPCPYRLVAPISPSIISTSLLLIASPKPVPPNLRAVPTSTCENGLNRRPISASEIPMPVSSTSNSSRSPSPAGACRILTVIRPCLVNLTAFPARFPSTCRRRVGSPSTIKLSVSPRSASMRFSFSDALTENSLTVSLTRAVTSKAAISNVSLSASMRE